MSTAAADSAARHRSGVWIAIAAYVAWGLMPLYWHLLKAVPAMQVMAHRVVWSALFVCGWLGFKYGRGWVRETLSRPHAATMLALSGALIAVTLGASLAGERFGIPELVAMGVIILGVVAITFARAAKPASR